MQCWFKQGNIKFYKDAAKQAVSGIVVYDCTFWLGWLRWTEDNCQKKIAIANDQPYRLGTERARGQL